MNIDKETAVQIIRYLERGISHYSSNIAQLEERFAYSSDRKYSCELAESIKECKAEINNINHIICELTEQSDQFRSDPNVKKAVTFLFKSGYCSDDFEHDYKKLEMENPND